MQAGCRRFDPVRLHHFFSDLVELVITGSQKYTACESKEIKFADFPCEGKVGGSFDIVKRWLFVPFDPHPGEVQGRHVNSG